MASDKNRIIVANYDEVARISPLDIISSGRYVSSAFGYSRKLGKFLARELELKPTDRLLDAGCNVGIYHKYLAPFVAKIIGVDASTHAIERARKRNRQFDNADYRVANLTLLKPEDFSQRFDKILCYSVVHFLGDLQELEALLNIFVGLLDDGHGMIFLGEIRETEMYEQFQNDLIKHKGSPLRSIKFSLLKKMQGWLLRDGKFQDGVASSLFRRVEIENLAARLGAKCERLEQASWHPFSNTCVDYRLRF